MPLIIASFVPAAIAVWYFAADANMPVYGEGSGLGGLPNLGRTLFLACVIFLYAAAAICVFLAVLFDGMRRFRGKRLVAWVTLTFLLTPAVAPVYCFVNRKKPAVYRNKTEKDDDWISCRFFAIAPGAVALFIAAGLVPYSPFYSLIVQSILLFIPCELGALLRLSIDVSERIPSAGKRALWYLFFLLGSFVAFPIYWFTNYKKPLFRSGKQ